MKTALTKFANQDLAIARKDGEMVVTNTKHGNVTIGYKNGQYTISQFNSAAVGSTHIFYDGRKAGAVEFLINAYQVVLS